MDDTTLWHTAHTRERLQNKMQTSLSILHSWCKKNHIAINPSKTVVMVNDLNNEITLELDGHEITTVHKTRYLGVELISKSGPNEQIYVGTQALENKIILTMTKLRRLQYAIPQHISYTTGKALLLSQLNYYLPVMGADNETGAFLKLQKRLNSFLRWLSQAPLSTPIVLLQSQTGIPPIELLVQQTAASNLARAMTNPDGILETDYWK